MDEELRKITKSLLEASAHISADYIQLPVANSNSVVYRERVYCYELYHNWRCNWPAGFQFSLAGELDKRGHPVIHNGGIPDFLIHIPGEMKNLLAMEVKPWKRAAHVKPSNEHVTEMVKDLVKLTKYRQVVQYHAAYFWVYGMPLEAWAELRRRIRDNATDTIDWSQVICFAHSTQGQRACKLEWE